MTDKYADLREALPKGLAERRTERDYYDYLAAVSPQAIAALLAERDAQSDKIAQDKATINRHESKIQELLMILTMAIEFDGEDEEGEPAVWLSKARAALGEKP